MPERRPCYGGPHDGRNATALRGPWAFIDADGRCYSKPSSGRALYRNDGSRWTFPGLEAHFCGGCNALLEQRGYCPLCGHGKPSRAARP